MGDENNKKGNYWKRATFILGIILIMSTAFSFFKSKMEEENIDKTLCSVILATPAWATENNKVLRYGTMIPESMDIDLVRTSLIPNRIKMLYVPTCPACESQINYFKSTNSWEVYKQEGLTVDCSVY